MHLMPTHFPLSQPSIIWQQPAWPALVFDAVAFAPNLDLARLAHGKLLGLLDAIGLGQLQEAHRELCGCKRPLPRRPLRGNSSIWWVFWLTVTGDSVLS